MTIALGFTFSYTMRYKIASAGEVTVSVGAKGTSATGKKISASDSASATFGSSPFVISVAITRTSAVS